MSQTNAEQRARILHLLCAGMSVRAIEATTGSRKHTISGLLNAAGAALAGYQDRVRTL